MVHLSSSGEDFDDGADPPPVQTLGETPPGAHQFVRIEYQRRGNPHGFRPGVPSTIE